MSPIGKMPDLAPQGKATKFSLDSPSTQLETKGTPPDVTTSGTKPGSLPESLSGATEWFLQEGTKYSSQTWGGVNYQFSMKADNSQIPSGQGYTSSAQGFWLSITTSGTSSESTGSGDKSQDWTQDYPNQYYVVAQPGGNGCYTEYSVYDQNMQPQSDMSVHYQNYIPNNMAEFAAEDPVGYQQFIQSLDKTIMKITNSMLSQLKQNFKQEQEQDWGSGASGGGC